jgi:6,7-dimethyl-8-ribityllumazine synthase
MMARISSSTLKATYTGILQKDACVLIVRTEWNASTVDELQKGCVAELEKAGVSTIQIVTVPGAVEIPFAVKHTWSTARKKDRPDAIITLGCVLRGDTPHFDYVCNIVANGVMHLNLSLPVPVIFGVLTVDDQQQAEARIGGVHGHKGQEAALTALKMIAWMAEGNKVNKLKK